MDQGSWIMDRPMSLCSGIWGLGDADGRSQQCGPRLEGLLGGSAGERASCIFGSSRDVTVIKTYFGLHSGNTQVLWASFLAE